jgi:hypothetical protein
MSLDAMKQALEALEFANVNYWWGSSNIEKSIAALCLAIEQAERQEPLVNIELSRRMAAVKVSNFYGSIIKDAEKEIERLHALYTAPPQQTCNGMPAYEGPLSAGQKRQPLNLGDYINDADITAADLPHVVVQKLQAAIERAHGIGGGE